MKGRKEEGRKDGSAKVEGLADGIVNEARSGPSGRSECEARPRDEAMCGEQSTTYGAQFCCWVRTKC